MLNIRLNCGRDRRNGQEFLRRAQARRGRRRFCTVGALLLFGAGLVSCRSMVDSTDRQVAEVIAERQRAALDYRAPLGISGEDDEFERAPRQAYDYTPSPRTTTVPDDFREALPVAKPAPMENAASTDAAENEAGTAETQPSRDGGVDTGNTGSGEAAEGAPTSADDDEGADEISDNGMPGISAPADDAQEGAPAFSGARTPEEAQAYALRITGETADGQPVQRPDSELFTLVDALRYAAQHRRELESAKERLYLTALSLTLERHLWTPIFAANLRTVYGNFGEIRDFDQAMRFVADLSVSQRLPYGGEFTAQAVSTLIRDVKKTITAEEGSEIELAVRIPFLRGAGHVAREELIQLERELTYAVRGHERFRRQQLVIVASNYFDLILSKQNVVTTALSYARSAQDFKRAQELEQKGFGSPLDTQRAEQFFLFSENDLERRLESFRLAADEFKLLIGMPVEEPLLMEEIPDIESVEAQVAAGVGVYALLGVPRAVKNEELALQTALENRLDLLTSQDRINDARRGVAIAKNDLLPDLDLTSSVSWVTDPDHYRLGDFSFERTTWRSELVLGLPLERTAKRNEYRASLLDVRSAQRDYQDDLERIRVDVRQAVNQIELQRRSVDIQRRNLFVATRRLEFAQIQYEEGDIGNRDKIEAEDDWTAARNQLNAAKTTSWTSVLQFRLATGTLRVDGLDTPAEGDAEVSP